TGVDAVVSGDVVVTGTGTLSVLVTGDDVTGPANVTLSTTGASADITTGGKQTAAKAGATLTLNASRDLLLGSAATGFGDVTGKDVVLTGGRDLIEDYDTFAAANNTLQASATTGNLTMGLNA